MLGPATVGASNQRVNFTTDVNFVVDDPTSRGALVKRIRAQTAPSLYLGVYATPTEKPGRPRRQHCLMPFFEDQRFLPGRPAA